MIHPDFLFVHSWEYQARLAELQADINESIEEVQTAVSSVLKESSDNTLRQYQTHVGEVEEVYVPMLEGFQVLKPGDCRNDAEDVLNRTTTNTGYRASNCAATYDNRIQLAITAARNSLENFDGLFSQVQSIVVKSFIGRNSFVHPESIEDKIIEIYDLVKKGWEESKPEVEMTKRGLTSAIAAQFSELVKCHQANLNYAKTFFGMFEDMVQTCIDFDNTPNPFARSARLAGIAPSAKKHAEFLAAFESQKSFEWQA
jgi:hypothetical protein